MSQEFEIKLEVPASALKSVQQSVARLRGRTQSLRAVYYDTPSRELLAAGLVLRVRKEGAGWVQTLKADSGRLLERAEHEVVLAHSGTEPPPPDVRLHAGSPAGERLREVAGRAPAWVPLFETEVQRSSRTVDEGASRIEIAFDRGRIVAGDEELALREIEFELKSGDARDAVEAARRWLVAHGLWLSTVTKFEKGLHLAAHEDGGPPASARKLTLAKRASRAELAQAALANALEQVLRNASEVARAHAGAEHEHQLRVGIRRVRTVLRELTPDGAPPGVEEALVAAFDVLGQRRDLQTLAREIEPLLDAAGAPARHSHAADLHLPSAAAAVRQPAFQDALLTLVALAHREPAADRPAKAAVAKRLDRLMRKMLGDALAFEGLDAARQHRVRKRMKRLRYLAEFAAPFHARRRVEAWLDEVKPAQDLLGRYNDAQVALAWYREHAGHDAHAWFAAGWLTARREAQAADCARALRHLAKAPRFWKND